MRTLRLACCVVFALAALSAGAAQARREQTFSYPFSRVWASAVRMLRVDYNSPITEKDKENGYFLFDFEHEGEHHPGSVELVRTVESGIDRIQVAIQVPAMPSYVEQMLLDKLTKKLDQEYGPPREPKPEPPPDDGDKAPPKKPDAETKPKDGEKSEKSGS